MDYIKERTNGIYIDSPNHRGFTRIGLGYDEARNLAAASFEGDRQRAANTANSAIQRQLSHEQAVRNFFLREPAVGSDDAERHRQVESWAFLLYIGGGQIDCDVRRRNIVAAILQCRANSISAFAHRGVRQADSMKVILISLDAGAVKLHLNNVRIDAVHGGA